MLAFLCINYFLRNENKLNKIILIIEKLAEIHQFKTLLIQMSTEMTESTIELPVTTINSLQLDLRHLKFSLVKKIQFWLNSVTQCTFLGLSLSTAPGEAALPP